MVVSHPIGRVAASHSIRSQSRFQSAFDSYQFRKHSDSNRSIICALSWFDLRLAILGPCYLLLTSKLHEKRSSQFHFSWFVFFALLLSSLAFFPFALTLQLRLRLSTLLVCTVSVGVFVCMWMFAFQNHQTNGWLVGRTRFVSFRLVSWISNLIKFRLRVIF